jgi:hypothetical protein
MFDTRVRAWQCVRAEVQYWAERQDEDGGWDVRFMPVSPLFETREQALEFFSRYEDGSKALHCCGFPLSDEMAEK